MKYRIYRLKNFELKKELGNLGANIYEATYEAYIDAADLDGALEISINLLEQEFGKAAITVDKVHGAQGQVTDWEVNHPSYRPASGIWINNVPRILIKDVRNAQVIKRHYTIPSVQVYAL